MQNDLRIGGHYIAEPYRMISGQAVAQSMLYNIVIGKSGRIWLYSTGDNVYVQGGPKSDGFGGALLEFKLANGCDSVKLKGAWHSNSESLFDDTGVDLRQQHLTFGVVGTDRRYHDHRAVIEHLLYFDEEPTYGHFNRITRIAQDLANKRGEAVVYYSSSQSGSSCGFINPQANG